MSFEMQTSLVSLTWSTVAVQIEPGQDLDRPPQLLVVKVHAIGPEKVLALGARVGWKLFQCHAIELQGGARWCLESQLRS